MTKALHPREAGIYYHAKDAKFLRNFLLRWVLGGFVRLGFSSVRE
jgi:hypothetical protein